MKATPEGHPDFQNTKQALALMEEIGAYVNEKKREAENIAKVVRIGEKLEGFAVRKRKVAGRRSKSQQVLTFYCLESGSSI